MSHLLWFVVFGDVQQLLMNLFIQLNFDIFIITYGWCVSISELLTNIISRRAYGFRKAFEYIMRSVEYIERYQVFK